MTSVFLHPIGGAGDRLCLDNLVKRAAGQAVQSINVMYGWDEREGLQSKSL